MSSSIEDQKDAEGEISLLDIVNFLQESWKKLALAAAVGAILGLSGWFLMGSYSAEYVLLNYNNNNSYALDIVSWKMLQKSLPNLAAQAVDENKAPENQASIFNAMSNDAWWQKNVVPSYALSKADIKDLAGINKDLDAASTTILSLTLTAGGTSKEQSIENVRAASQFLRSGGAYLQIRSLLNGYEGQTLNTVADLEQKITNTQIEMGYQIERAKSLEELLKRFPGSNNSINQQYNVGDSGGKFLPLPTQIIAVNTDINQNKEVIARLQKRLDQLALAKNFLEQALILQDQTFDGLMLDKQLLEIESNLRAKLDKNDYNGLDFLSTIRAQLLSIQVRFTKGLEANAAPTSSGKKGMMKSIAGGLASAFFLMLLALLGQRVWQTVKSGGAK